MQRTLALIKSMALVAGDYYRIIDIIKNSNLRIVACIGSASEANARDRHYFEELYAEHAGKPYYAGLISSVTQPIQATILILEGENAVADWRELMGNTDPSKAAKGTIRQAFGKALPHNAVHGSDSVESALREISIFYPGMINDINRFG